MKERIVEFIEAEKISPAEFADRIGVQRSSVSHVLNGRNNPGFAFIQKILESFPKLNSRWLLTGEGSMYEGVGASKPHIQPKAIDLFSTPETVKDKAVTKTIEEPKTAIPAAENERLMQFEREEKPVTNNKKVVRVLIFYDDQTFEDFRPAK